MPADRRCYDSLGEAAAAEAVANGAPASLQAAWKALAALEKATYPGEPPAAALALVCIVLRLSISGWISALASAPAAALSSVALASACCSWACVGVPWVPANAAVNALSICGHISATVWPPAASTDSEASGAELDAAAAEDVELAVEGAGAEEDAPEEEELLEQPARAIPQTTVVVRSSARFTVTPFDELARGG